MAKAPSYCWSNPQVPSKPGALGELRGTRSRCCTMCALPPVRSNSTRPVLGKPERDGFKCVFFLGFFRVKDVSLK